MTTDQTNYLNIGLMAISLVAAFILPFEVFLFSYAILGPLHYLTEISWLHDRKYFSPGKWDYIPLVILSFAILLGGGATVMGEQTYETLAGAGFRPILDFLDEWGYDITFVAFGLALLFVLFKGTTQRIFGVFILLIAAYLFHAPEPAETMRGLPAYYEAIDSKYHNPYWATFAVYIPTLIHVYIFTGAFMLVGALRRDSRTGYLSIIFFIFCAISCFIFLRDPSYYAAGGWAKSSYGDTFERLNQFLMLHFGGLELSGLGELDVFANPVSVMFARFIAFAYTYHYLNWFSKTKIIGWHKVPKARFIAVIVVWLASIALYLYNYSIGFRWLFLLSFAHVLLEFPLNHQSFIGIGKEVRMRFDGSKKAQLAKGGKGKG